MLALPGDTQWFPFVEHTVDNLGDQPFNAVYICLKGRSTTTASDSKVETGLRPSNWARSLQTSL
jgi:hypothetical protein